MVNDAQMQSMRELRLASVREGSLSATTLALNPNWTAAKLPLQCDTLPGCHTLRVLQDCHSIWYTAAEKAL
jgi:hypothetical protein